MKKIVCFLLCIFFIAFAQTSFQDEEQEENFYQEDKQEEVLLQDEKQEETSYQDEKQEDNIYSKSIFLSYENIPSSIYVGEIFPITIKAIITRSNFDKIVTYTINENNFLILNPKSEWIHDLNNQYFTNTFYLQALNASSKLPNFSVELVDNEGIFLDNDELEGAQIEIAPVGENAKFSGVVAQSFKIANNVTNKFDDTSLIVTLEIEATYSNLKNFKLKNYTNGSINAFKDDVVLQYIEYDIIVPNYTQSLEFTYFNTKDHDFQTIHVPLHVKSDDVSTHTDLNPKDSKFKLYKDIFFVIALLLLIALFIYKKQKAALVGAVLIGLYLFYSNNPFNKIKLDSNTTIRVLPTEKSSVFHVTEGELEVEKLSSKNDYIKILLPSGRIGWVKEKSDTDFSNVTKN
ncbi:MAG: hypothetical protein LBG21_02340 [Campylobacteraceae bacterium]|jgi:hypothetical protein|nr:hypothetical protein [Campylobacteraceae bacterium]